MPDRPYSKQRAWQLAQKAARNCVRCGRPRDPASAEYCPEHAEAVRERNRKRARHRRLTEEQRGRRREGQLRRYKPTGRPRGRPRKGQV